MVTEGVRAPDGCLVLQDTRQTLNEFLRVRDKGGECHDADVEKEVVPPQGVHLTRIPHQVGLRFGIGIDQDTLEVATIKSRQRKVRFTVTQYKKTTFGWCMDDFPCYPV